MASKCSYFGRQCLFWAALVLGLLPAQAAARDIWDGARLELVAPHSGIVYSPGILNAIALDSKGRIYVLYGRGYYPGCDSIFFKYKDPDHPWGDEIALPVTPLDYPHAGVVVTPNDDVAHFLYLDGGYYEDTYIVHGIYNFSSSSWVLDTVALTTRSLWEARGFRIDADPLGGVHVVWDEPVWNEEYGTMVDHQMYAENTTGRWRTQVVAGIGTGGSVVTEPDGRAHVTYLVRRDNHNFSIFAINRFRGDTVWTSDSVDTSPSSYTVNEVQRGRDGSLHALFHGCEYYGCLFSFKLFYTWRPPGTSPWAPWQEIYDTSGSGLLRLDCAGKAHVLHIWFHPEILAMRTFYATNVSGSWTNRDMSFGDLEYSEILDLPSFVIDRYDRAHAVFDGRPEDGRVIGLYHYSAPVVLFDVFDIVQLIDYVFLAQQEMCDPLVYDRDCDETVDIADVMGLINYVFSGGPRGCRF